MIDRKDSLEGLSAEPSGHLAISKYLWLIAA